MTDTIIEDCEVKFEHYVKATLQVIEEFRDVLVSYDTLGKSGGLRSHQVKMQRIRLALDGASNALRGIY
jgi:hypothetical protein